MVNGEQAPLLLLRVLPHPQRVQMDGAVLPSSVRPRSPAGLPASGRLGRPSQLGLSPSLQFWATSWSRSTGAGGVAWPPLCLLLPSGDVSGRVAWLCTLGGGGRGSPCWLARVQGNSGAELAARPSWKRAPQMTAESETGFFQKLLPGVDLKMSEK